MPVSQPQPTPTPQPYPAPTPTQSAYQENIFTHFVAFLKDLFGAQPVYAAVSQAPAAVDAPVGEVYILLSDHLGSTTVTLNLDGSVKSEIRYDAWGATRYTNSTTPTERHYTGQIEEAQVALYFYNARWYDSTLGRFAQPDKIVPEVTQGIQAWDRFAYSNNSPIIHNDPSGNCIDGVSTAFCIAVAVGAVTGGISSAIGYITATKMLGQEINYKSLAIATGSGVVAGALAPIIAITAPVTAIVPATLIMYGTMATTQYIVDQKVNNKPVDAASAMANFGVGAITGIIGGVYSPFDEIGREGMSQGLKLGMDFGKQATFQGERIAAQEFIKYQLKNGLANLARTFTTSLLQTLAPKLWDHNTVIAQ